MIPFTEEMYNALLDEIRQEAGEKDTLIRAKRTVDVIMKALRQLKERIKRVGFTDEQEEIHFYRQGKPQFHALYIYHATIFSVESDKPLGSKKASLRYIRNELHKIDNFFYHHVDFYKYYKSGKTYLDKEYFTRGHDFDGWTVDALTAIIDEEYCTVHSLIIACFIAYQQLREYFEKAKEQLTGPVSKQEIGPTLEPLIWTDTKVGLVELAYSLHAKGSFNNGNADLTLITAHMERDWNVRLGNTSRSFQEVLSRETGATVFLEKLIKALIKRMKGD